MPMLPPEERERENDYEIVITDPDGAELGTLEDGYGIDVRKVE